MAVRKNVRVWDGHLRFPVLCSCCGETFWHFWPAAVLGYQADDICRITRDAFVLLELWGALKYLTSPVRVLVSVQAGLRVCHPASPIAVWVCLWHCPLSSLSRVPAVSSHSQPCSLLPAFPQALAQWCDRGSPERGVQEGSGITVARVVWGAESFRALCSLPQDEKIPSLGWCRARKWLLCGLAMPVQPALSPIQSPVHTLLRKGSPFLKRHCRDLAASCSFLKSKKSNFSYLGFHSTA